MRSITRPGTNKTQCVHCAKSVHFISLKSAIYCSQLTAKLFAVFNRTCEAHLDKSVRCVQSHSPTFNNFYPTTQEEIETSTVFFKTNRLKINQGLHFKFRNLSSSTWAWLWLQVLDCGHVCFVRYKSSFNWHRSARGSNNEYSHQVKNYRPKMPICMINFLCEQCELYFRCE